MALLETARGKGRARLVARLRAMTASLAPFVPFAVDGGKTPVSSMRSFWGLMCSYWFSERWKEAWGLTITIALLTALSSKASVWLAETSGDLVNAIAYFHDPATENPLGVLVGTAGTLVALVLLKDAGFIGIRHFISTTLHRKWRGWLDARFNAALLDANHTHYHVQNGSGAVPAPDNIDQRVQDSIKGMTGGAIGLAMGVMGVTTAVYFIGRKLIETSTVVAGLEFLGSYGSAVLAFLALVVYVPLNTIVAVWIGKRLQRLNFDIQRTEGSYRGELTTMLRRSFHVAAARGEAAQQRMHERLYHEVDGTWGRLNRIDASYMSFTLVYNFIAARIVAYMPGLFPYMHERISLRGYVTGAELLSNLINECSWFIHVMPAIASLNANATRVTELAQAIENVQTPRDFYNRSGLSAFVYDEQHPRFGMTIRGLELMHQGETETPFLRAGHLRFRRGEWTFLRGESGSGKTGLIKAINGLWAYGRGDIVLPQGIARFYAAQDVKLPSLTLKQLVCLPDGADDHSDARVAAALHKAGLGDFIEHLGDTLLNDKPWDQLLSGGQKQKLVLSRILLHRPGLLFLDEATSALDPAANTAFHQAIKDNSPDMIVVSVMHEIEPPRSATGADFYDSVLSIEDGVAVKRELKAFWERPRAADLKAEDGSYLN